MNPDKLSDFQLFLLVENDDLSPVILTAIRVEMERRGLSLGLSRDISKNKRMLEATNADSLGSLEKLLIILFPFFTFIHAIVANRHISRGNMKSWKQYWKFVKIGFLIWMVLLIVFCVVYRLTHLTEIEVLGT